MLDCHMARRVWALADEELVEHMIMKELRMHALILIVRHSKPTCFSQGIGYSMGHLVG